MSDSNEFERIYTVQYNTVSVPSAGPSAPCIYPTEDLPISSQCQTLYRGSTLIYIIVGSET